MVGACLSRLGGRLAVAARHGAGGIRGAKPPTTADRGSLVERTNTALVSICQQYGIPLVVGYTRIDRDAVDPKRYNSTAYVDPVRGLVGSYDKVNLVPWTEFTPQGGLTRRRSMQFSHGTRYPVFELRSAASQTPYRFASAICFDVAFSDLFRGYMADDNPPDFFLVSSSERSDGTGRMSRHVLAMAKVRAIECRRAWCEMSNVAARARSTAPVA